MFTPIESGPSLSISGREKADRDMHASASPTASPSLSSFLQS